MFFIRKLYKKNRSSRCVYVAIPPPVLEKIGIGPGDDLMFVFQPGGKEVILTKSPYESITDPRPWTKEETELLERLCKDGITQEVADRFNRSRGAVYSKAHELGFKMKVIKQHTHWSMKEENLIIRLFSNTNTKDLAKKLGRSAWSIQQKAFNLGLRKAKK